MMIMIWVSLLKCLRERIQKDCSRRK